MKPFKLIHDSSPSADEPPGTDKSAFTRRTSEQCASSPDVTWSKSTSSPANLSHIYVLYSLVVVLSGSQIATLWFGSCRLSSLQRQLDGNSNVISLEEVYTFLISKNASNRDTLVDWPGYRRASSLPAGDELLTLLTLAREGRDEGQGQRSGSRSVGGRRSRRNAGSETTEEDAGKWDWMSARSPLSALQGYCREARLFCAAEGQPGPPGQPGPKGEPGNAGLPGAKGARGDKGAASDPFLIAQNLESMESFRGPPGPKGDRGDKGNTGDIGVMGPRGASGRIGLRGPPGQKGDKGDQGHPGDKGMRGLIGFPGIKAPRGASLVRCQGIMRQKACRQCQTIFG